MKARRFPIHTFLAIELLVACAFVAAQGATSTTQPHAAFRTLLGAAPNLVVPVQRLRPLRVEPLYDDANIASDEELAAVLERILPRFAAEEMKPNFVEHALRTWGVDATFRDPEAMTGMEMVDFLTDHGRYLVSWGADSEPLLVDRPGGVAIRWDRQSGGSVHHDHWLASLTEAGVALDEPVFTPTRRKMAVNDALQESLRDFRLDEREVEWSAMAFGLWIAPTKSWRAGAGRLITFDLLAQRLMRGDERFGVCSGTHRLYSLMLLLRLDSEFDILSSPTERAVYAHLEDIRDLISESQFEAGYWPSNWSQGADAVAAPIDEPDYKRVIATGHHLEWLAIAPEELHPSREQIRKAADWIIKTTIERTDKEIARHYTFYSHVGRALALWRSVRPADLWRRWETAHASTPDISKPVEEGGSRAGSDE